MVVIAGRDVACTGCLSTKYNTLFEQRIHKYESRGCLASSAPETDLSYALGCSRPTTSSSSNAIHYTLHEIKLHYLLIYI